MTEYSPVKACERLESDDVTLRELDLEQVDARFVRALNRPSCLESLALREGIELCRDLADVLAKQTQLRTLNLSRGAPGRRRRFAPGCRAA